MRRSADTRDERGRFSSRPFDENELRNRIDLEEVKNATLLSNALENGLVIPDDSMSPELWRKAFEGRMKQQERDGTAATPTSARPPREYLAEEESAEPEPEASQAEDADQAILTAYNERAAAFAAENPDFSDVVGSLEIQPMWRPRWSWPFWRRRMVRRSHTNSRGIRR